MTPSFLCYLVSRRFFSAGHAGDVQAVVGIVVDVVQVEAGGALIHLHSLLAISQLSRQNAVYTGRQAAR